MKVKMMGLRLWTVLVCCFSIGKTQHNTTSTFSNDVRSLIHDMEQEIEGVKSIVDAACKKMEDHEFADYDSDHILAGEIVYMYTSPSQINHQETDALNRNLNRELLKDNTSAIWTRFANVLSTALDMFGEETYAEVYRGEKAGESRLLEHECSKRFFSTTLNPDETDTFGGNIGIFHRILNVGGTNIQKFAVQSEEAEILIKPGACFETVYSTRDANKIKREMEKIKNVHKNFTDHRFHPEQFIVSKQHKNHLTNQGERLIDVLNVMIGIILYFVM